MKKELPKLEMDESPEKMLRAQWPLCHCSIGILDNIYIMYMVLFIFYYILTSVGNVCSTSPCQRFLS